MVTKIYRIYGKQGHRQRMSFSESFSFTRANGEVIEIRNADVTGTNEYSEMVITAESAAECDWECDAQTVDGVFESCGTGRIHDVTNNEWWGYGQ